jgi:hypothetical protein
MLWPTARKDGKPSQHYHLMQIPFDAEIVPETGYAKTYQILLHFGKTLRVYSSKEVTELVAAQLLTMGMDTGEILEPIAPLCSARGAKPWNNMVKIHLKNPETHGQALLTGARVFLLQLDNEIRIPKIAKGYNNLAAKKLLTITISSPNLRSLPQHEILTEIIVTSFHRGQEYKIPQVHKLKDEAKAYLVGASPKKCKKLELHQVSVQQEILQPKIASKESYTKKVIKKKNCLTLIVKNCNIAYPASTITKNLKRIMGDKNIVQSYFPRGDPACDLHAGICNLEVLNPSVYKQYVKKT